MKLTTSKNKQCIKCRGAIDILALIGLTVLVIALPFATNLALKRQEIRKQASCPSCQKWSDTQNQCVWDFSENYISCCCAHRDVCTEGSDWYNNNCGGQGASTPPPSSQGGCPAGHVAGGCGDSRCCRDWETYQEGCCRSRSGSGCAQDSDCEIGVKCIGGVCGGGGTSACGGPIWQCSCGSTEEKCIYEKLYRCGNDCCFHKIGESCGRPTPTSTPIITTTPTQTPTPTLIRKCFCPHGCTPGAGGCWWGDSGPNECSTDCCSLGSCPKEKTCDGNPSGTHICASSSSVKVCINGEWIIENCVSGAYCDSAQGRCVFPEVPPPSHQDSKPPTETCKLKNEHCSGEGQGNCCNNLKCAPFSGGKYCAEPTCNEGNKRCSFNSRYVEACQNGQWVRIYFCDVKCENNTCVKICEPGKTRCSDDKTAVEKCSDTGGSWGTEKLCSSGSECQDGKCQTKSSQAPAETCKHKNEHCSGSGQGDCCDNLKCAPFSGGKYCVKPTCDEGYKKCSDDSNFLDSCQNGQMVHLQRCDGGCENNACKKICTPPKFRCYNDPERGWLEERCSDDGLNFNTKPCPYGCLNNECRPEPVPPPASEATLFDQKCLEKCIKTGQTLENCQKNCEITPTPTPLTPRTVYVFEYLNAKNDSEKLKIIKESVKNVPSDRLLDIHSGAPIPTLAGPAYVYREAFSACGAKGWFIISGVCQSLNAAKWEEAPYIARGLVQSVKNGEITLEQAFKLSESDTWVSREFAKQATENLPELKEIKDDLGTPRIKLSTVLTSILSWGHSDSYAGFIHGLYNIQEEKDKRAAEGNPMSPQEEKNLRDQAALAPVAEVYTAFVLTFAGEIAGPTINPIKSAASRFLSEKAGQVMVKLGATEGESLGTGARQVGQKVVKAIGDAAQGLAQKPKPPSEVVPPETIPPAAEAPKRLKIPKIDLEGFALNVEKFFGVTERNLADDVADTIIQEGLQGNEARLSEAIRQELSTMGYKPQDISKAVERVLKLASQRAAKDLADTESGIFNALVKAGWQGNEPTLESAVDDMLARAQLKPNSSQFASVKNNILDRFRAKAAKIPVKVPVQPAQKPITVQTGGAVSAEPLASHGEVVQDYAVAGTKTATIGDGVSGKPSLGKKSVNAATAGTRQTNAILERSIADGKDAATIAKTVKAQVDALQPQILQTEGGTTLIGAGITSDGKVVIPRVGDGMAGVIRDGQFYHLNNPTNINGKPLFPGQSLPPEFAVGPEMQATGPYNPNQLGIGGNHGFWWGSRVTVNQVQPGDIIVIGSDGILGNVQRPVLTTEQVVKIIQSSKGSAEAASQAIVRQAIATSNNLYHALVDDMSAAVIFVGGK